MKNQTHSKERLAKVHEYCRKFANRGNRTIARALLADFPEWFPTLDTARSSVSHARGNRGAKSRRQAASRPALVRDNAKPGEFAAMPATREHGRRVFSVGACKALVISDLHVPFHDIAATEAALEMGQAAGVDTIYINGDFGDFFAVSRFLSNPQERDLAGELRAMRAMLGHIRHRFPKARILLKKGNHDERWEHYLWQKAPELLGLPEVDYSQVTGANEFDVKIIGGRTLVEFGRLMIVHGHEIEQGASSPVNPARGLFMRTLDSYLMGHRHRTSEHTEKTANGRFITCWSVACLCGLWPEYAVVNKWNHGAAIVEVRGDGSFTVHNRRIHEGKVM